VAVAASAAAAREENGNMNKSTFISKLDHPAIEAAIARAEEQTSGEIRVFASHESATDPVAAAQAVFAKLGMTQTRDRNGVLIFVAPASQTFAIIGDEAVHQKCGEAFWRELADVMTGRFKQDDFTGGLLHNNERAGALLAEHFTRRPDDTNELSNTVVES
jgi:uncharacterized membrane protein